MKTKDKVLVTFLVSAGFFSFINAVQYVKNLSDVQKTEIRVLVADNGDTISDSAPRIEPPNEKIG